MSTITPHFIGLWAANGEPDAGLRHRRWWWSLSGWPHVLIDSLIKAQTAHATYCRLIRQGVKPSRALRTAFGVDRETLFQCSSVVPAEMEQDQ